MFYRAHHPSRPSGPICSFIAGRSIPRDRIGNRGNWRNGPAIDSDSRHAAAAPFRACRARWNGRPAKDRLAIARAFVAKAVYNFPTTRDLIERLQNDAVLRRICGWDGSAKLVPHEPSFSRAFQEFADMEFPQFRA